MLPTIVNVVLLFFGIAVLFLIPTREVTQPPGKLERVWEVLLPGTAPVWNMLGGVVLIAWCYFVLQDFLLYRFGTPYLLAFIAMPNISKVYGVPAMDSPVLQLGKVGGMINPSWIWVYLAPAVLFVVNLFLVLRARRRA